MIMSKQRRLSTARNALFRLQEVVLDILYEEERSDNPSALHPHEIGKRAGLGIPGKAAYGDNPYSLIWGILDSLAHEGRVTRTDDGAKLTHDVK